MVVRGRGRRSVSCGRGRDGRRTGRRGKVVQGPRVFPRHLQWRRVQGAWPTGNIARGAQFGCLVRAAAAVGQSDPVQSAPRGSRDCRLVREFLEVVDSPSHLFDLWHYSRFSRFFGCCCCCWSYAETGMRLNDGWRCRRYGDPTLARLVELALAARDCRLRLVWPLGGSMQVPKLTKKQSMR